MDEPLRTPPPGHPVWRNPRLAVGPAAIIIVVFGRPAPQGSKRAFALRKDGAYTGRVAMTEQTSATLRPWREAVKAAALETCNGRPPLTGSLEVGISFYLPRPKGHYRTGRRAGQLRDSAPLYPASIPDLSKLARSTEDALTDAGIWADDSLIVLEHLAKHYASPDAYLQVPGARIAVTPLPPPMTSRPPAIRTRHGGRDHHPRKEPRMITIYGASDDLVEVGGCEGADEFNVYDQTWSADLIAPDGEQMRIHCWYGDNDCWQVGLGQADEKHQLPAWPVTITQAPAMNPANPGYSALLSIDAPGGTRLMNIRPGEDS